MKKKFNDTGICVSNKHYMADTTQKNEKIFNMIEEGLYFTINRPRQYGKSTTKSLISEKLMNKLEYLPISISFESIETEVYDKRELFIAEFLIRIVDELRYVAKRREITIPEIDIDSINSFSTLSDFISKLADQSGQKIVLLIDEVDKSCNNQLFLDFLAMLRNKFLSTQEGKDKTFHSVILIGVHDVKTLKLKLRPDEQKRYNSPWNIAVEFELDMSFSPEEIRSMLEDYKKDSNLEFDTEYFSNRIRFYTSGYPYLVSKVCKIIDERIAKGNNWKKEYIEDAIKMLIDSNNANFDELIKNLENNEVLRNLTKEILLGVKEISFSLSVLEINLGYIYGIFARNENGKIKIHNKIYEEIITIYLTGKMEVENLREDLSPIQQPFIKADGRLDIKKVLLKFQEVIKEKYSNRDLLKSNEFLENDLRMLFLVFLKPIINGIGFSFKEVQTSAERRLDIIIIFRDEKFVIELKLWNGQEYHEEGIVQIKDYMRRESIDKGYMLIMSKLKDKKFETDEREGIFMVWL